MESFTASIEFAGKGSNAKESLPLSAASLVSKGSDGSHAGVNPTNTSYQSVVGQGVATGAPKSKQVATVIRGVHTEVVITPYQNIIFVVVTQLEKLGTLVE
jgi:sulfite reductase beta subunit-like hemoprotein